LVELVEVNIVLQDKRDVLVGVRTHDMSQGRELIEGQGHSLGLAEFSVHGDIVQKNVDDREALHHPYLGCYWTFGGYGCSGQWKD
jgi:hypothetical protein